MSPSTADSCRRSARDRRDRRHLYASQWLGGRCANSSCICPQSDLEAHGLLGAYPITSPSSLAVDFHSHNLAEFDTALRSLGFKRNGKTGTAALPVSLAGQADFHGAWTGSLARPRLAGTLKATQLAFEWPAEAGSSGPPQIVRFDSVSASGQLSPSQIAIQHAQLQRGTSRITLGGALDASPGASPGRQPEFDANSVLHARIDATNLECCRRAADRYRDRRSQSSPHRRIQRAHPGRRAAPCAHRFRIRTNGAWRPLWRAGHRSARSGRARRSGAQARFGHAQRSRRQHLRIGKF